MDFDLVGEITSVEPIAIGRGIRDLQRLRRQYGKGHWKKVQGVARVKLLDGTLHTAEIHWYEAHGLGRKEYKLKLPLMD